MTTILICNFVKMSSQVISAEGQLDSYRGACESVRQEIYSAVRVLFFIKRKNILSVFYQRFSILFVPNLVGF